MGKIAFLVLFLFSFSFAGVKEFLDNSVIYVETTGSTIDTDTRRVYFGGGYSIRTPTVSFQPFQVKAPSVRAGCGGIDIAFGAFSYFNKEYLVNFLKAVSTQAPAFAFQTAIQTLCPQCSQLMTKLTQLANSINGLNFNSCQAAQLVGGETGEFFASKINESLKVGATGPDWLKTFNDKIGDVTGFINNDVKNMFSANGCNPNDKKCPANFIYSDKTSLLEYAMEDVPYIGNDTAFISLLRTMIGDIVKTGNNGANRIKFKYITPGVEGEEIKRILAGIAYGEIPDSSGSICNLSFKYDRALDQSGGTQNVSIGSLCKSVKEKVDDIATKLINRQALTQNELNFLGMFKVPVYQIFNTLSLQPDALLRAKNELIVYLTYELEYDVLSSILSNFTNIASKMINGSKDKSVPMSKEDIKDMMNRISTILEFNHELVSSAEDSFSKQIRTYFNIQRLRGMLMASLARHPMMDSRLYSQSLLGF